MYLTTSYYDCFVASSCFNYMLIVEYRWSTYFTDSDFDRRSQNFTIQSGTRPGIILRPTLPIVDDLIEEDEEGFIAVLDVLQITEGALLNNTARNATVIRIFDDDSEYSWMIFIYIYINIQEYNNSNKAVIQDILSQSCTLLQILLCYSFFPCSCQSWISSINVWICWTWHWYNVWDPTNTGSFGWTDTFCNSANGSLS